MNCSTVLRMNRLLMSTAEFGLGMRPDEHGRIEPLRGDDADGEHGRQNGDDGILDHQRDAVAERPVGRHPMPEQLADGEEQAGEHPVADQHIDERPLPRREAEDLRGRVRGAWLNVRFGACRCSMDRCMSPLVLGQRASRALSRTRQPANPQVVPKP